MQPVLECINLKKSYVQGPTTVEVLKDVNFSVARGERIAIVGASGAGKSTLLNLLGGLDQPTSGQVTVAGQDLFPLSANARGLLRNRYLGFVYQFHHLLGEFTALENVVLPLLIGKVKPADAQARARDMLEKVGLAHRLAHKPSELSGGERQRVAIARALVTNPACVLMDEPTGNLDRHTAATIQALMKSLNDELAVSFVVVTHDEHVAASMDRVVQLADGTLLPYEGLTTIESHAP